jgi:hypothetical protein
VWERKRYLSKRVRPQNLVWSKFATFEFEVAILTLLTPLSWDQASVSMNCRKTTFLYVTTSVLVFSSVVITIRHCRFHFRESMVPLFVLYSLQRVFIWYSCGTVWYTNKKKCILFSFFFYSLFIFIGRFVFFICL